MNFYERKEKRNEYRYNNKKRKCIEYKAASEKFVVPK